MDLPVMVTLLCYWLETANAEGLIDLNYDQDFGAYSYIIKASGEVHSFWLAFPKEPWP